MTSPTQNTEKPKCKTANDILSYRKEYKDNIEIELGHIPDYDEEQESEIPKKWYEPLKDF